MMMRKTSRVAARRPANRVVLSRWSLVSFLALAMASSAFAYEKPPVPDDLAPPADAESSPSGLKWKVLSEGTGTRPADKNDRVAVHFTGWTAAGAEFQSTYGQEKPAVFEVQSVFPGWAEAMQMMLEGETRRFWIPGKLGPKSPRSGPSGDVVFDVQMVAIQRIANPPESLTKPPEDAERGMAGGYSKRFETGWGDEFPAPDSAVLLHYTGWTTDGKTFDSTTTRGRPTAFPLGKVMEPFSEAIQRMVVGEKRHIWIPGNLAAGNWPGSPSGMLIFEVQLMNILPEGALQSGAINKEGIPQGGPMTKPGS
ncbi:MAG: FKBP-type peptidyl-prolyl cis-trans isomerase [Acidobacteriota bacterium]